MLLIFTLSPHFNCSNNTEGLYYVLNIESVHVFDTELLRVLHKQTFAGLDTELSHA